jgi:hypothetical protein
MFFPLSEIINNLPSFSKSIKRTQIADYFLSISHSFHFFWKIRKRHKRQNYDQLISLNFSDPVQKYKLISPTTQFRKTSKIEKNHRTENEQT